MTIQVIGTIVGNMIKQPENILEFLSEFRDHGIVNARKTGWAAKTSGIKLKASFAVTFINPE